MVDPQISIMLDLKIAKTGFLGVVNRGDREHAMYHVRGRVSRIIIHGCPNETIGALDKGQDNLG